MSNCINNSRSKLFHFMQHQNKAACKILLSDRDSPEQEKHHYFFIHDLLSVNY